MTKVTVHVIVIMVHFDTVEVMVRFEVFTEVAMNWQPRKPFIISVLERFWINSINNDSISQNLHRFKCNYAT
jgi:hypothetical protein